MYTKFWVPVNSATTISVDASHQLVCVASARYNHLMNFQCQILQHASASLPSKTQPQKQKFCSIMKHKQ